MAGKVLNKVMDFLGLEDQFDEIEEIENEQSKLNEEYEIDNIFNSSKNKKQNNKVVSIHTASSTKVVIVKPNDYDEAIGICDHLKNRKITVVNMTKLESKVAQRLLDFMAGASYALDGSLEKVEGGVYLLSPSNVDISNEFKDELTSKGLLNWNR
ncbi:cell division protein SepF [Clostridium aestuarii]|uniref:Cell division protein SepF n=1 Tax=Clostridium aestuarii TaxID=338193 RepID=A0ABT4CXK4_9CLOT|nr:cell division protein SepF [Clostridium aestuarii]